MGHPVPERGGERNVALKPIKGKDPGIQCSQGCGPVECSPSEKRKETTEELHPNETDATKRN